MYSYAPMEQLTLPVPGRPKPRWSRLLTGGAAHTDSLPALIAGLPGSRAMVCVGPPLFAKPAGSSWGLVLQNELPVVAVQPVPVKPHVAPFSMLWPPSVMVPPQFSPEVLLATIVLVTVTVPPLPV